ncbi:MAG: tetratricopeptide repeat protein [PVC group bacterium]
MSIRAKRWFYDQLTEKGIDLSFLDALITRQKDPANFNRLTARQLYLVAHPLKDENEAAGAIEAFKRIVWKFPNESFTPDACLSAFELQVKQKQYDGALALARAMIERYPDAEVGKGGPLGAIGYFSAGVVHFARQEYREAADAFETVARDYPAAANIGGVSLRSLIAEQYLETVARKDMKIQGIHD